MFRARFALLAFAVCTLVTGCGGGYAEITAPPSIVSAAAKRTESTGSFRSTVRATYSLPGHGSVLRIKGTGRYDTKRRLAAFTMRLSGKAVEACPCDWKRVDFVFDADKGLVAYVRWGLLRNEMPAGKEWVRIDLLRELRITRAEWEQAQRLAASDPSQILDQMVGVESVNEVGFDRIRGRFVTRYEVEVDLVNLDTQGTSARAKVARQLKKAAKELGFEGYTAHVWIDQSNRLRRVSMDVEIRAGKGKEPVRMSVTEDFHDFGKPVRIQRPPAGRTWDPFRGQAV